MIQVLEISESILKDKKTIKERYDNLGSTLYDIRYTLEQQAKYSFILKELKEQDLILDNGCGTGLFLPILDYTVVGIDISNKLLEKAIDRKRTAHHLIQGDSEYLPLRDSIFSAVVSVTVIQNLTNPKILAKESTRISKPGSIIIISSLKKIYNEGTLRNIISNEELSLKKIFTKEKINDWITVSIKN
jgi:ubiquinone/menaquinone biosynthesis C-methylase UbiE